MFKPLWVMFSIVSLSACVAYYPYPQYEPTERPVYQPTYEPPFETTEPKHRTEYPRKETRYYKISTEQMNRFILAKNNLEACLLPELGRQGDDRLTALEKQLLKEMINEQLENIVGKASVKTIYDDPNAYRYFQFKYNQLKHDLTNIRESECRDLKERYNQRFKESKRQRGLAPRTGHSIERRMQEQQASIEERMRRQRESIERRMQDQQKAMERKIYGTEEPLYQPKKEVNIDWSHPFDRW
ncbi:DUF5358 family protein [Pasteurella sp. PK-2025]|uniref:DUF5358 family protein n=1 Tax=Pasteurella sp. PK-2025 TaxID=3413133 RepID=UPI003C730B07